MIKPPLTGPGPDRAAHLRQDPQWLVSAWSRAMVVMVQDGRTPVRDGALAMLKSCEVPENAERYFLGLGADETPYFAVRSTGGIASETGDGTRLASLHEAGEYLSEPEATLFATAVALVNWHAGTVYSPKSGRPTTVGEAGWTRVTEDGTETLWPRTDPAVIVLIHDGVAGGAGRCLLGTNVAWQAGDGGPRYSCIAGFVEPGESAEQSVVREVAEEVGVGVRRVRYVTSQPWPFPRSLMLGFLALADPQEPIALRDGEIAHARWFSRHEITAVLAGEAGGFTLPLGLSIARHLITEWVAGRI